MNAEIVIFCESYPHIKNALYLATHNEGGPVTLVVTGNKDLFSFLKLVNEKVFHGSLEIISFEPYRARTARPGSRLVKALHFMPEVVQERRYLAGIYRQYFARMRQNEVYFFSGCYNASTYYLLRRLCRNNRLTYMPDPTYDVVTIPRTAPAGLVENAWLAKCRLVYGRDIELGLHPLGQKITRMPASFCEKQMHRRMTAQERNSLLKGFDLARFELFDAGGYSAIYFHEDLVEHSYITDEAAFENVLAGVFNVIAKSFPEERVGLKYHPSSQEGRNTKRYGRVLPHFIPAEFLYNDAIKLYIGFTSMALANVPEGTVVSLIDLIPFRDSQTRERMKEYLVKWSRTKIRFPASLAEFEEIAARVGASISTGEEAK